MSYYRAALAAAREGKYAAAMSLVECSILLEEENPSAIKLKNLLQDRKKSDIYIELRSLKDYCDSKSNLQLRVSKTFEKSNMHGFIRLSLGRSGTKDIRLLKFMLWLLK